MLTNKWHTLNANFQKFNAAYKRAKRLGKSAENDVDLMKRAQIDLTGDVPGATQEDLFGHDARPRPAGKPRPAKKTKSDTTASTDGSSASTQFGELMEQEFRLKREAAERAFETQAEKDRTLMWLEELRFLATSTKDLDDDDAYWIKKQKRLFKNKMRNDLGDEDDEDEAFEVQAEKDRTLIRLEELRFLATSTKNLGDVDAYWIKKQKRLIRNKMENDLGAEDDEDEDK
nr:hypothetical protein [Tanacetum cinerariifolium]